MVWELTLDRLQFDGVILKRFATPNRSSPEPAAV